MKRTLWNDGWKVNGKPVCLPRDEMIYTVRDPGSPAGDSQGFYGPGRYVYEKSFDFDSFRACLFFDGVYRNAKVYLNDVLKAGVPYGYIPFKARLGEVHAGDTVRVECDNEAQPDSRWYTGAGIYRNVVLYTAAGPHIAPRTLKVCVQDYRTGTVRVTLKTSNGEPASLEVLDGNETVARGTGNDTVLQIPNPKLWSEAHPFLYTLRASLGEDFEETRFGIRQIEKGPDGIYLNGKRILLRGGCVHHDNGLLGAASLRKSELRKIRKLKEAGFNAIRSAHNPASEELLNVCDELGMYVIEEMWDMWFVPKKEKDYASLWEENHLEDIRRVTERDFNHPCVLMYSLGNEIREPMSERGYEDMKEMTDLFHKLDPQKLVTAGLNLMILYSAATGKKENDVFLSLPPLDSENFNRVMSEIGPGMNHAADSKECDRLISPVLDLLDVAGYNYASGRYSIDAELHPDRLILGTETMTYDVGKNWKLISELKNVCGDFMWTAWDHIGENGIGAWAYTDDAESFAKPYPWRLSGAGAFDILGNPGAPANHAKAVWHHTDIPLIHLRPVNHDREPIKAAWRATDAIASYSWKGCDGKKTAAEIYFDADRIDLYQNARKIGSCKPECGRVEFPIVYHPGVLEAIAYDSGGKELCRASLVSADEKTQVVLRPEEASVKTGDIVYVNVHVEDRNGIVESNDDREVRIEVENGELIAFSSADPRTEEDMHSGICRTYYGKAQVIVKASCAGIMKVKCFGQCAEITVKE